MIRDKDLALKRFLQTAESYLGTPYIFGGDDPSGLDCSGFVVECLKAVGFLGENEDYSANGLLGLYQHHACDDPRAGAILFYLDTEGKAFHVVICLDDCYQIGASGGTGATKTTEAAWQANAYVKIRPIPRLLDGRHKLVYLF